MTSKVLQSTSGETISWLEATIRTTRGIGRPARIHEIENYMEAHVVEKFPDSASTPRQTIYKELYTHSKDSIAGKGNEHVFYSPDRGVWGLIDRDS